MFEVEVGVYYIGNEQCRLVLREGDGGEFIMCPGKGHIPVIKIGWGYENWYEILKVVLHEAFEFVFTRLNCRYIQKDDCGGDHSAYLFITTHPQFSDCCGRVADFMSVAMKDIENAWIKTKKA